MDNKVLWGWDPSNTLSECVRQRFLAETRTEAVTITTKVVVLQTAYQVMKLLVSNFERHIPISGINDSQFYTIGYTLEGPVFVVTKRHDRLKDDCDYDYDYDRDDNYVEFTGPRHKGSIVSISLTGPHDEINNLISKVRESVSNYKAPIVRWWSKSRHGSSYSTKELFLDPPKTVLNKVFYPTIDRDPKVFLEDYLNSDQSILLLSGPPGVGKTTFLRHLLFDFQIHGDILYDQEALKSDDVFHDFLFESPSTVMIVEDADNILKKREGDSNPLMARFLNVGEGLIKLPNKKLIFTTNIEDFDNVDSALIRPGRCFDVLKLRAYNYDEAKAVCEFMGWERDLKHKVPEGLTFKEKTYTIAELSSNKSNLYQRKVGYKG